MSSSIKTIIVGLSGPSSSGKTTLARQLRTIFNNNSSSSRSSISTSLFILHEDDFYKTDTEIPTREVTSSEHGSRTLSDWDCVESLNLPLLKHTLQHISTHGTLPADMSSKEDQNTTGKTTITDEELQRHKEDVSKYLETLTLREDIKEIRICILDGFLLYPPPPSPLISSSQPHTSRELTELHSILTPLLTLKLFLSSTFERTVTRRAARSGYVTMEGFWTDPPGYVEDVVWPNYARDHAWLFSSRQDVDDGRVDLSVAEKERILVGPGQGDVGMSEVLQWGVGVLRQAIRKAVEES